MFNTATKAQIQELIEYIASKMSVIDVSTIADANNVEEGYFNETDNKFYKEANYTTEITGKSKTIYISLNTDLPYYFNGSTFTALSSPQQQITVDSTLDDTSENPIQNKVVTEALDDKQDTLDAGDGIDITDNTISIDEMPAEDMSEIIPQLPPIRNNRMKYSTEEQIIGEWINGKPLYQKVLTGYNQKLDWIGNMAYTSCSILKPINNVNEIINARMLMSSASNGTINWIQTANISYSSSGSNWTICSLEDYYMRVLIVQYTKTTD